MEADGLANPIRQPYAKHDSDRVQTLELVVSKAGPSWISGEGVETLIIAPGIQTVDRGHIKKLQPREQKKINLGSLDVEMFVEGPTDHYNFTQMTYQLSTLDWGPYAVPGWVSLWASPYIMQLNADRHGQGNSTPHEVYAEWYWWYGRNCLADKANIYDHQLETDGPDVDYDDFSNFTAENWNAKSWVDLFLDAGAQYFVITTKHHDGFPLLNAEKHIAMLYTMGLNVIF